jgi:hypothetical protein
MATNQTIYTLMGTNLKTNDNKSFVVIRLLFVAIRAIN